MTPHEGTHGRYANGCRCDACKEAHRIYTADRRKAALLEGTLSHGRASTYWAGCRCDKCYEARRVVYLTGSGEYKAQRRIPEGKRRIRDG